MQKKKNLLMELQSCSKVINKVILTDLAVIKGLSFSFHLEVAESKPSETLFITDPKLWKTMKRTQDIVYYTVSSKAYSFGWLSF